MKPPIITLSPVCTKARVLMLPRLVAPVVITSSIFASAFGTYSVESSGPTVTLRGKESFENAGTVCITVGAAGLLTSMIATLAVQGGTPGGGVEFLHSLPVCQNRLEFATANRVSLLNNPRPTGAVPWVSPYPTNALFGEDDTSAEVPVDVEYVSDPDEDPDP